MKAILTLIAIGAFGGYALADVSDPISPRSPVAAATSPAYQAIS
ncbi:MAG: hypothetical protein AAF221_09080 [Pseudomonadota bacterium]